MPTEINGFRPRPLDTGDSKSAGRATGTAARSGGASAPAAGNPAATDTVSLTDTAARLRELDALLARTPDMDPARVEALRQQIAEGRYSVDAVHVADKLISLERSLSDGKK